jgi:hypothetical protein
VPDKPPDKLWPGDPKVIGPYRLIGRLGRGGMGDVFLGRSAGGRSVAVKVIRADFAADPEFRTRFRQEVAAARRVNGLYTAPVADADVDGPMPWLATAYVPGPSLDSAVAGYGPLPARSVLGLAAGLAEGIAAIHAVGLVHRDLKPSNVLLAADGPRVIDFGIARFTQSTGITRVGMVVGSPDFMSPEQAAGRLIGPPSDVFSLGGVLAFAATGRAPFAEHDETVLFAQIASSQPDLTGVPAEVRPLIEWCMAKAPRDRPAPQQLLASLGETRLLDDWLPASLLADLPAEQRRATGGPDQRGPDQRGPDQRGPDQRGPDQRGGARRRGAAGRAGATRHDDTITTLVPVTPTDLPTVSRTTGGQPPVPPGARVPPLPPRRRAGRPERRTRLIAAPAMLAVLAAAGVGIWLATSSHHGTGNPGQPTDTASPPPLAFRPVSRVKYQLSVIGATTGGCLRAHASAPGRPIRVDFTDKTTGQLAVYWVDYQANREREIVLNPGETREVRASAGNVWLITDGHGCVATFTNTQSSHITVASPAVPARPASTARATKKS